MRNGRKCTPSLGIIDAQSVKNSDTSGTKGYDAGKKISGIKRHILVDTQGLPHAISLTAANVTDRTGAIDMIKDDKENLASLLKILVDAGYTGEPFRREVLGLLNIPVEVVKRSEIHTFKVIPKRWFVDDFAWIEKCRRLWKNCERLISSSVAMVQLVFISLILNRS